MSAIAFESIIKPKRPTGRWVSVHNPNTVMLDSMGYPHESWFHAETGLFVISALEKTNDEGAPDLGPEYHLSVSLQGKRCSSHQAKFALSSFDLSDAKEDNHVPSGKVRNFWRPIADNLSGYECPCTDNEPTIREDKGDFIWRGITK